MSNYKVVIKSTGATATELISYMPEAIFHGIASEWSSMMPGLSLKSIVGNTFNKVSTDLGNLAVQAMTAIGAASEPQGASYQVWGGSSPLEFNLLLLFDAVTSAKDDVLVPILTLEKLAAPGLSGGRLAPPGPKLVDISNISGEGTKISIAIGNYLYISNVVITNVNPTLDTRLDKQGYPISGQAEVTVRTVVTPTADDLTKFFLLNGSQTRFESFGDQVKPVLDFVRNVIVQKVQDALPDINILNNNNQ